MGARSKKTDLSDEDEPSQFGSVILQKESQRLQTDSSQKSSEDHIQESSQESHGALKRSFIDRFHCKIEELLKSMAPCYEPTQYGLDSEMGLICIEVLDKKAGRGFSQAPWA